MVCLITPPIESFLSFFYPSPVGPFLYISSRFIHVHTHQQEMKTRGDTLILNQCEGCGWLYGTPSAAILDLDSKQVEFITLATQEWKY